MTTGIIKKTTAILLTLAMAITGCFVLAPTKASAAGSSAPRIEDVDYESRGKVSVDFYGKVRYKNVNVTVKDTSGNSYKTRIIEKDNDELEFKVLNYKTGTKYTFTINGIKTRSGSEYTKVSGTFRIHNPNKIIVEDVEYDREDREVSFDFKGKVRWNKPTVKITNSAGKNFVLRIVERDNDEITVRVSKLNYGAKYKYKISGIKARGAEKFKTISGNFRALED